jgi:hypothetical protein
VDTVHWEDEIRRTQIRRTPLRLLASDLVILHTAVTGFKKGSELERNLTTVGGATSITVHCKFTDKEGKVLLERDIDG